MRKNRITPRVLVVDDEKSIGDTLAIILKMHGFEAHAVYSGEAAVERVESFAPDILLSDIIMQPMDGIEAAQRVQEVKPECRIVLFSGALIDEPSWLAIQEHGFEYLGKPLHPENLVTHLKTAGEVLRMEASIQ
jgi:DNA-binding NtrC family response regulator